MLTFWSQNICSSEFESFEGYENNITVL